MEAIRGEIGKTAVVGSVCPAVMLRVRLEAKRGLSGSFIAEL
jgi:hypothetical protein